MNFIDSKEERHERVAQIAANICKRELTDPTEALYKVATQNALNPAETEDVCAKLNHILFREKFAEDKLAVFNAAQYDKVQGEYKEKVAMEKVASEEFMGRIRQSLEKRAAEIAQMPTEDPSAMAPQPDPIMENASEKLKSHEFSRFLEQTAANASEISAHHMAIDNIVGEMKNRIIALFREGVPLDEIYNTILTAVGDSQAPAVQQYFMQVVEDLKQEGLIPMDEQVHFGDPSKIAADFSVDPKLTKMAQEVKTNTDLVIIKEAAHHACLDYLTEIGRFDLAEDIDKHVETDRFNNIMEKRAATGGTGSGAKSANVGTIKEFWNAYKVPLLVGAGAIGAGGAIGVGQKLYTDAKKSRMKKKLPNMYPELKDVPQANYENIYDTIVNLNPGILKAPWALSEMIKRYSDYGTMDTGNILDLQRVGGGDKGTPLFSDIALKPTQDTMSAIIKSRL